MEDWGYMATMKEKLAEIKQFCGMPALGVAK